MNYKYIILDFGNVLAGPTTGEWFVTPKFKEVIDMSIINSNELNNALRKHNNIISRKMMTEEEEYQNFYEYYSKVLKEINYTKYDDNLVRDIAHNFAFKSDKYTFFKDIKNELEKISKKYKLIMLTDNWPCITRILQEENIDIYFDKIYISSNYGVIKSEGLLFDYPIKEYDIKKGEALFIDDMEENLDVAIEKGLDVFHMDRNMQLKQSKYTIINDLLDI